MKKVLFSLLFWGSLILLTAGTALAQNFYLRFYGNGTNDIDRVKIPINSPASKADVAYDFTIEFKIKANASNNPGGASANQGYNDDWTLGHIIIDRDIFGNGDYGDYGISLAGNRIAFGVNNGSQSYTLIGGNNIANGQWRYIAVTRQASNGHMQIFVDGNLVAQYTSGVTGDISYRNDRSVHPDYPNEPFIVIGAEKHDYDNTNYPSYNGFFDELRISDIVRYTSNYSPVDILNDDANTMLLYHFDEGNNYTVTDFAIIAGSPTNGTIHEGGSPTGPEWTFDGYMWNGTYTSNWDNGNNWKPAGVPTASDDVVIRPGYSFTPTISDPVNPAECKDLYVMNGQTLLISNTGSLTVHGQLFNNGSLMVQSNSTSTGSLIHNTSGVNATVERYVAAAPWTSWDAGWHLISSPVASQAISAFETTGAGNDYDFYGWRESDKLWLNYKSGDFSTWNGGSNFVVGRGYLISYQSTQTKSFSGNLNVSDVSWSNLSYNPSQGNGWHLLGNPFASALKWNDGNWALSNVAGTAKIWHSTNKSYSDIAANGIIPQTNGFMVQVSNATNSLTIPAAARVHSTTAWYKNSDEPHLKLIARPADNSSAQEFNLKIEEEATQGYDFYWDSQFLPGYAPFIYALCDGVKLSTSAIPYIDPSSEILLGFKKIEHNHYIIELAENTLPALVYLNDLKTGVQHNLSQNPTYAFMAAEDDPINRFKITFASVGIEPQAKPAPIVYAIGKTLFLHNLNEKAMIEIYNPAGQLMMRTETQMKELPLSLASGVYLVKITGSQHQIVEKIFIR